MLAAQDFQLKGEARASQMSSEAQDTSALHGPDHNKKKYMKQNKAPESETLFEFLI
jgi:hypothetical protein